MDLLVQILISGFVIGVIYALGEAGMTIIFGVSGILNLAYGVIVVLASMVLVPAAFAIAIAGLLKPLYGIVRL